MRSGLVGGGGFDKRKKGGSCSENGRDRGGFFILV